MAVSEVGAEDIEHNIDCVNPADRDRRDLIDQEKEYYPLRNPHQHATHGGRNGRVNRMLAVDRKRGHRFGAVMDGMKRPKHGVSMVEPMHPVDAKIRYEHDHQARQYRVVKLNWLGLISFAG